MTRSSAAQIFGSYHFIKTFVESVCLVTNLRAVSHKFREEDCLLHFVPHLDLEGSDGLGPGGQQAVQHTLAGRGLDDSASPTVRRARQKLGRQPCRGFIVNESRDKVPYVEYQSSSQANPERWSPVRCRMEPLPLIEGNCTLSLMFSLLPMKNPHSRWHLTACRPEYLGRSCQLGSRHGT